MIRCALFDLDGTLVDTLVDLGRACDYVLERYGRKARWSESDYRRFVGNGARKLIDRAFEHTLNEEELDEALVIFKEKYNEILIDNAAIYDGVKEQLDLIRQKGIKIGIVTNKPHHSAVLMAEALFGKGYFDCIYGARKDVPIKPDPYQLKLAIDGFGCKPSEAIYFGDSDIDVFTARNAGVEAIACSWGYRSFECLMAASPSAIIDEPKYIFKLF